MACAFSIDSRAFAESGADPAEVSRGMAMANTLACIMAGARIIETSLGMGGGQPAFMVEGIPGKGTTVTVHLPLGRLQRRSDTTS